MSEISGGIRPADFTYVRNGPLAPIADVFSLGVALYQLIFGFVTFPQAKCFPEMFRMWEFMEEADKIKSREAYLFMFRG